MDVKEISCETSKMKIIQYIAHIYLILFLFLPESAAAQDYPRWVDNDMKRIPRPATIKENEYWDIADKAFFNQIGKVFDLGWVYRKITNRRREADNINSLDEVPNSSWFTNRHFLNRMTPVEMAIGPNKSDGPNTSGTWEIVAGKFEGVTVGFTIRDSNGDRYVIKFDPIGLSELASGAEIISTKFFYAMGFNVPENYIVYFDPSILRVGATAKVKNEDGKTRRMNDDDLKNILTKIPYERDGAVRCVASKFLPGIPLGPLNFNGRRRDDPNDRISHEHRRELRSLQVIGAWLNDTDRRAANSLDMFVEESSNAGYVKHYIIDFGFTLGNKLHQLHLSKYGNEYILDLRNTFRSYFSLGFYDKEWLGKAKIIYPSIGYYESEYFDPLSWVPSYPNPAMENRTVRDGFWAAKFIASVTDAHINAVVETAEYTDPDAKEYMNKILRERRDKIGRYWYGKVNAIDLFRVESEGRSNAIFYFQDLAIEAGYETRSSSRYEIIIKNMEPSKRRNKFIERETQFVLPDNQVRYEITIRTSRNNRNWSKKVTVLLVYRKDSKNYEIVAVRRES